MKYHSSQMGSKRSGNAAVRNINWNRILRSIWESTEISRASIALNLGLCAATVSSCVETLSDLHFVRIGDVGISSGGRRPVMIEIDDESLFTVGVEVRKTGVSGAIISLRGRIIAKAEEDIPMKPGNSDFMSIIIRVLDRLREIWTKDRIHVIGIGIGMHGIVDFEHGLSIYAPAFNSRMVNIKEIIASRYNLPVTVDNDIRCMVLAEKWYGKCRSFSDFVFVGLGEGVGGGLMLNGKVFRGARSAAGEIGHIRVSDSGRKCVCGNYGCLDTVASIKGFLSDIIERIQMGYPSILTEYAGSNSLGNLTLELVIRAAREGDELAISAFHSLGMYVGRALAGVVSLLNPEAIIIGGEIATGWDFFGETIQEIVSRQAMQGSQLRIMRSSFPAGDGVIGGAALIIDNILSDEHDLLLVP